MFSDIVTLANYEFYNVKLANILGLEVSIYLNQLLSIYEKALRKDKIVDNYFTIDRKYITERTTFSTAEQKDIDLYLMNIKVAEVSEENKNRIKLNFDYIQSLYDVDKAQITPFKKTALKVKQAMTKEDAIKENLKMYIQTDNLMLYNAYSSWVDSVFDKNHWMSKTALLTGQQIINNYCQKNIPLALEIINIASINGYRDMSWAINTYSSRTVKSQDYAIPASNISTSYTTMCQSEDLF